MAALRERFLDQPLLTARELPQPSRALRSGLLSPLQQSVSDMVMARLPATLLLMSPCPLRC